MCIREAHRAIRNSAQRFASAQFLTRGVWLSAERRSAARDVGWSALFGVIFSLFLNCKSGITKPRLTAWIYRQEHVA